jgi:hypothetical protein
MASNKITSFRGLRSGTTKEIISIGFVGDFSSRHFRPHLKWWGLESSVYSRAADVIVYSYDTGPPFEDLENRGTPVVVVDESNTPSLSADLVRLLRRPEVHVCFRKYGFRDPKSYFRRCQYYEGVYESAMLHSPPDHFPIIDDDPMGNAIRKVRVSLPACDLEEELAGWVPYRERSIDVLCIGEHHNDQTAELRRRLSDFPGTVKWLNCPTEYQDLIPIMSDAKLVVSTGTPSPVDLCATVSGCVHIKPECSNVYATLDVYRASRLCIRYCDPLFAELSDTVSAIYANLGVYEQEARTNSLSLLARQDAELWAIDFRDACVSAASGLHRLGDHTDPLPMGR